MKVVAPTPPNPHLLAAREKSIPRLINQVYDAILATRAEHRRADKGTTTLAKTCPRAASTPPSRRSFARQNGVRLPEDRAKPHAQAHPKPQGPKPREDLGVRAYQRPDLVDGAILNRLQRPLRFLSADLRRKAAGRESRRRSASADNKRQTIKAEGGRDALARHTRVKERCREVSALGRPLNADPPCAKCPRSSATPTTA